MIEKIAPKIFLIFMPLCAVTILSGVWTPGGPHELQAKTAFTFFVMGLASFLVWSITMVYTFYKTIARKN